MLSQELLLFWESSLATKAFCPPGVSSAMSRLSQVLLKSAFQKMYTLVSPNRFEFHVEHSKQNTTLSRLIENEPYVFLQKLLPKLGSI